MALCVQCVTLPCSEGRTLPACCRAILICAAPAGQIMLHRAMSEKAVQDAILGESRRQAVLELDGQMDFDDELVTYGTLSPYHQTQYAFGYLQVGLEEGEW